jgi:hypothetical protein
MKVVSGGVVCFLPSYDFESVSSKFIVLLPFSIVFNFFSDGR